MSKFKNKYTTETAKEYAQSKDGIQHFAPFDYYGGEKKYQDIIKKDAIKNNYCKENNIPLLRIRYDENNIENKVYEFLAA